MLRISTGTADKLVRAGFVTADGVRAADEDALFAIENIDTEELKQALARLKG